VPKLHYKIRPVEKEKNLEIGLYRIDKRWYTPK
jgi:hypothetical protein